MHFVLWKNGIHKGVLALKTSFHGEFTSTLFKWASFIVKPSFALKINVAKSAESRRKIRVFELTTFLLEIICSLRCISPDEFRRTHGFPVRRSTFLLPNKPDKLLARKMQNNKPFFLGLRHIFIFTAVHGTHNSAIS